VKSGDLSLDELKKKTIDSLDEFMGRVEKEKKIRKDFGAELIND